MTYYVEFLPSRCRGVCVILIQVSVCLCVDEECYVFNAGMVGNRQYICSFVSDDYHSKRLVDIRLQCLLSTSSLDGFQLIL